MVPEKKKKTRRYKQINFIGLHNKLHPSQHTVGNVHKASGNCQQRPLYESITEQLSDVGLPPYGGNPTTSPCKARNFNVVYT
jgi:hypothetical protein